MNRHGLAEHGGGHDVGSGRKAGQDVADAGQVVGAVPDLERRVPHPLEPAGHRCLLGRRGIDRPAQERPRPGKGKGEDCHLNLPLRWGSKWDKYEEALTIAMKKLKKFAPDVVVVSLGLDTFKEDPISKFKLEHEDYLRMGEMIAGAKKPTLFVFEGGYAVDALGINTVNVLAGFEGRR